MFENDKLCVVAVVADNTNFNRASALIANCELAGYFGSQIQFEAKVENICQVAQENKNWNQR